MNAHCTISDLNDYQDKYAAAWRALREKERGVEISQGRLWVPIHDATERLDEYRMRIVRALSAGPLCYTAMHNTAKIDCRFRRVVVETALEDGVIVKAVVPNPNGGRSLHLYTLTEGAAAEFAATDSGDAQGASGGAVSGVCA